MKAKPFDCVEMKNKIQAEHLKRFKGLTYEEEIKIIKEEISKDPAFARIMKSARKSKLPHGAR